MKFAHVLSRVTGAAWCVTDETLHAVASLLQARINGEDLPEKPVAEKQAAPIVQANGFSIVPLSGIIGKHLSSFETMCGGCDIEEFSAAFIAALANPASTAVVLLMDSPGGIVTGVPEMHAMIRAARARSTKQVFAYTDTQCCSAAYYLAAACEAIYAAPTARVGSIGVVAVVRDVSAKLEKEGVKLHVFKNGTDKALGADGTVPQALAKQFQAEADFLGNMFRTDMLAARPKLSPAAAQGRAYYGAEAVRLGLADAVFPTLIDCLSALAQRPRPAPAARAASASAPKTMRYHAWQVLNETARHQFLAGGGVVVTHDDRPLTGLARAEVATARSLSAARRLN